MPNEPQNFFKSVETHEEGISFINLNDIELAPFIPDPLTTPDLLSLFFHNTDTVIDKPIETLDQDTKQRRYFADTLVCYECGDVGHTNKKCPKSNLIVCILCCSKGHDRFNCPMMVCHKCYKCGHNAKVCPERKSSDRYLLCKVCKAGEHTIGDCPRKWRQYIVSGEVRDDNLKKACCLCYSDKHYVDDCKFSRTKFSIFNSDFKSIATFIKKN